MPARGNGVPARRPRSGKEKGMTLVEAAVAAFIFAILMVFLFMVHQFVAGSFAQGKTHFSSVQDMQNAVMRITGELRQSSADAVSLSGDKKLQVGGSVFEFKQNTLTVQGNGRETVLAYDVDGKFSISSASNGVQVQIEVWSTAFNKRLQSAVFVYKKQDQGQGGDKVQVLSRQEI